MSIGKKIVVLMLILSMIALMTACQKSNNSSNIDDETQQPQSNQKSASSGGFPEKLDDPNLSIMVWGQPGIDGFAPAVEIFEKKYGGKVNFTVVPGGEKEATIIARMTAGDAFDIILWGVSEMPRFAIKGLIQPVEQYINLNDPEWQDMKDHMERFKYKGHIYGIPTDIPLTIMYFNKTMFENNGIPTPMEYYKQGKWNWETFQEVCIKLTQDTDRDGNVDQWGFVGNQMDFVLSNDAGFVQWKDDGSFEMTIDDTKVIDALRFWQDAFNLHKYIAPKGWEGLFAAGKLAMFSERASAGVHRIGEMKDEFRIAPFPQGPSNTRGVSPSLGNYWAICNGAKNPKGAATLLKIRKTTDDEMFLQQWKTCYTDEEIQLFAELKKKVNVAKHQGLGDWNKKMSAFWNDLKKGTPVVTVIEKHKPIFQAEIDATLKDSK